MPTPRNVIWITTDHMRFDCIGAHGNATMHTPNLDALVSRGVTFERCYANNPLCMPSRCSFMTGCYPQQTGVMGNGQELPPDFRPTVMHQFRAAGYRTVQIGKLHFQCHEDMDLDPRPSADYGFDVLQLSEEPGCYEDAYRTWLRGEHPDLVDTFTVPRPMSEERHHEARQFKVLDAPWECSHSGWVATQACRYLGAWGLREEPQFLHLGFYAPHPPLNPTREMFEPYRDADITIEARNRNADWKDMGAEDAQAIEYRRHFYAMVTGVDMAIGKLVAFLKTHDIFDNTLLIFSSDHGDTCGDHGRFMKGNSYYEGIMRMPWVMHWPDGLGTDARRVDGLVELIDIVPTISDMIGVPKHPAMQGNSYAVDLLAGQIPETRIDVYAVDGPGDIMLRTDRFKYLRYVRGEEVLYDLENDPHEFRNVASEPEHAQLLHELRERTLERTVAASSSIRPRRLRF